MTWHELKHQRRRALRLGPHMFLQYVRERAALFSGLAESTMSRDEGWLFLLLGRSLERIDMTARLLLLRTPGTSRPTDPGDGPDWWMLLRASGAEESYVRTHGGVGEPHRVAAFLLLDKLFPRSAVHALATAEQCLAALDPAADRVGVTDPARRPIGLLRTRLEYADSTVLLDELPALLSALQTTCLRAGDAIADRYFQYVSPVAWAQEG